jgi:hypothetical protein
MPLRKASGLIGVAAIATVSGQGMTKSIRARRQDLISLIPDAADASHCLDCAASFLFRGSSSVTRIHAQALRHVNCAAGLKRTVHRNRSAFPG